MVSSFRHRAAISLRIFLHDLRPALPLPPIDFFVSPSYIKAYLPISSCKSYEKKGRPVSLWLMGPPLHHSFVIIHLDLSLLNVAICDNGDLECAIPRQADILHMEICNANAVPLRVAYWLQQHGS